MKKPIVIKVVIGDEFAKLTHDERIEWINKHRVLFEKRCACEEP